MPRWGSLLLCLASVLSVDVVAQRSRPITAFDPEIHDRIVTLPLVARGHRGAPVPDLAIDQISIREGKNHHPLESLSRVHPEPVERDLEAAGRLLLPIPEEEGYDVFEARRTEPRYMVLLFDLRSLTEERRTSIAAAMREFLEDQLDPSVHVGLMTFDGERLHGGRLLQDRTPTLHAIEHLPVIAGEATTPGTGRIEALLSRLDACEVGDSTCVREAVGAHIAASREDAGHFVDALEHAIESMRGFENHRAILVLGEPVSFTPAADAVEAVAARFGQASAHVAQPDRADRTEDGLLELQRHAYEHNTSLSFIDVSELGVPIGERLRWGSRPSRQSLARAREALEHTALMTGGTFIRSTAVDTALPRALEQMESIYYLSFFLPDEEPLTQERIREMTIESLRPGVTLEFLRAFESWRNGLIRPTPPTPIAGSIEARPSANTNAAGKQRELIELRVSVDPRELVGREAGQLPHQIFLTTRLRDSDGELLVEGHRALILADPTGKGGSASPDSLHQVALADLPEGDYVAEVLIRAESSEQRRVLRRQFRVGPTAPASHAESSEIEPAPAQPPTAAAGQGAPSAIGDRPAVTFSRRFLGIVSGVVEVAVLTSAQVDRVELLLDGEAVAALHGEPWSAEVDLGSSPRPRLLRAIAFDRDGAPIGSALQRLNLPRNMAEVDVVISKGTEGGLVGRLTYDSVGNEEPAQIVATIDGARLEVSEALTISIPDLDMEVVHVLRVEALFPTAGTITREVPFGGRYSQQANARLSSHVVRHEGRGEPALDALEAMAGLTPVPVVAIEKGQADLIVIVDPAVMTVLPEILATIRPGRVASVVTPMAMDEKATPAESGIHISLLWPLALEPSTEHASSLGYRLFPSSDSEDVAVGGGLIWHLGSAVFPETHGLPRFADAVATAGPMAVSRGRRRAVLLLHAGNPDASNYRPTAARHYLEELGVPLFVWSLTRPEPALAEAWGRVETITHLGALRKNWSTLMQELDRQRVVWIEGEYLPRDIELSGEGIEPVR